MSRQVIAVFPKQQGKGAAIYNRVDRGPKSRVFRRVIVERENEMRALRHLPGYVEKHGQGRGTASNYANCSN